MKKIMFIMSFLFVGAVAAATEGSALSKIEQLYSFSESGGGDVTVRLSENGSICAGYWLKKTDPGFQANLSMIIAAYHAKSDIVITGHTDQIWAGSGGKYCHVYSVGYRL